MEWKAMQQLLQVRVHILNILRTKFLTKIKKS
jgi:hypothetical protein